MGCFPVAGGGAKYNSFNLGDLQSLVEQMPSVSEGGALWLMQLDKLTAANQLALGDFRAVAARCLTASGLR